MVPANAVGLLLSGGIDSAVLLSYLLRRQLCVQPFYVRCGLAWEEAELSAVHRLLNTLARAELQPLVVLDSPVEDLYASHWSLTGEQVPDSQSVDEAVFLPGRNALLVLKAGLWCQMHGISQLALAPLCGNPFADATDRFFETLESLLEQSLGKPIQLLRPFARWNKDQVLAVAERFPFEDTFSCIRPNEGRHCGNCNKCAERQTAFERIGVPDPTCYANQLATPDRFGLPHGSQNLAPAGR